MVSVKLRPYVGIEMCVLLLLLLLLLDEKLRQYRRM